MNISEKMIEGNHVYYLDGNMKVCHGKINSILYRDVPDMQEKALIVDNETGEMFTINGQTYEFHESDLFTNSEEAYQYLKEYYLDLYEWNLTQLKKYEKMVGPDFDKYISVIKLKMITYAQILDMISIVSIDKSCVYNEKDFN